jgi:hypothetical protein
MKWVKKHKINRALQSDYHPTYKIFNHEELSRYFSNRNNIKGAGVIITELGDKFMMIKWERFRD